MALLELIYSEFNIRMGYQPNIWDVLSLMAFDFIANVAPNAFVVFSAYWHF
jgi:hypothetical protein